MNILFALIVAATVAVTSVSAASYSTEMILSLNASKSQYEVAGTVSKLIEHDGEVTEEVIAHPKVISSPGSPGSFYVGEDRFSKNWQIEENITMDVSWPKQAKGGFAICTIIVKRGDTIVSKSTMRVQLNKE